MCNPTFGGQEPLSTLSPIDWFLPSTLGYITKNSARARDSAQRTNFYPLACVLLRIFGVHHGMWTLPCTAARAMQAALRRVRGPSCGPCAPFPRIGGRGRRVRHARPDTSPVSSSTPQGWPNDVRPAAASRPPPPPRPRVATASSRCQRAHRRAAAAEACCSISRYSLPTMLPHS